MIYIKVKSRNSVLKGRQSILMRFILFFFKLIIPKANPDYEDKIDLVTYWLLEFEDERSTPDREIGLDIQENVIAKMPDDNNYGYWVDNNLTLVEFRKSFEVVEITKEYFDDKWKVEPIKT